MESKISAGFIYEIKSEHVRKRGKIITGIISQTSSIACWVYVQDRKKRLQAAGYDYRAVQRKVNELMR